MSKAGKLRVPDSLGHILEAIGLIHLSVEDMAEVKYFEDAKTQDALIRNFEIIDEAFRNIDLHHPDFTQEHPVVPWGFAVATINGLLNLDFSLIFLRALVVNPKCPLSK